MFARGTQTVPRRSKPCPPSQHEPLPKEAPNCASPTQSLCGTSTSRPNLQLMSAYSSYVALSQSTPLLVLSLSETLHQYQLLSLSCSCLTIHAVNCMYVLISSCFLLTVFCLLQPPVSCPLSLVFCPSARKIPPNCLASSRRSAPQKSSVPGCRGCAGH